MNATVATHTPGRWFVFQRASALLFGECVIGQQVWSNGTRIAFLEQQNVGADTELANARLIAAAPDLLAALRTILEGFESGVFVRDVTRDADASWSMRLIPFVQALQKAQTAILKAEGRYP